MTVALERPAEAPRPSIPPAFHQARQPPERLLDSSRCGLLVQRTGQIKGRYRSEGRQFARELAEYINDKQLGLATVFVFEETFGTKERLHWLIHLRSLDDYPTMVAMGAADERFRELILRERLPDGGRWDRMFLDGSLRETVLVPQRWAGRDGRVPDDAGARHQVRLPGDRLLHSANASSIVQVSGVLRHRHRERGRRRLRELTERFNAEKAGTATALLYDEAFGTGERVHWLIHLAGLGRHRDLAGWFGPGAVPFTAAPSAELPDEPAAGDPGGDWRRLFVDGTLREVSLTPQFWGMYATEKKDPG